MAVREGDWTCPSCSNNNYAIRVVCNRCSAPKMMDNVAQQMNSYAMLAQEIGGMGYGAVAPMQKPNADRSSPYGLAPGAAGAKGEMRPGDWTCPSCSNHNYANREVCNRCNVPKSDVNFPGFPSAAKEDAEEHAKEDAEDDAEEDAEKDVKAKEEEEEKVRRQIRCELQTIKQEEEEQEKEEEEQKEEAVKEEAEKEEKYPGQWGHWNCRACSNLNHSSAQSCDMCGVSKSAYIAKSGMREGDWLCPNTACNNHNFADKHVCNRCSAPKGTASTPLGATKAVYISERREGDWTCMGCNNHNYANREVCNRCKAPKL